MRRVTVLINTVFAIFIFFVGFAYASANDQVAQRIVRQNRQVLAFLQKSNKLARKSSCKLPDLLTTIEDSAFEGTAIEQIELPDNLEFIGDLAFSNIDVLQRIIIPNATKHIGKDAFKGSDSVTIEAAPNGYARAWAQEHGVLYHPIISFYAYVIPAQVLGLSDDVEKAQKGTFIATLTQNSPPKPTGRMGAELQVDQCEVIFAHHIQERSPPIS